MKRAGLFALLTTLSILLAGCSNTMRKLERSGDNEEMYAGAVAYYEQGDYGRADLLFDKIYPYYRGASEAEKIKYYSAFCDFYQGFYEAASYEFQQFYQVFGRSDYAEEAQFMEAYSLYLTSPNYEVDQSSSEQAVVTMQTFLNRYPVTKYYQQANDIIDELQVRFETKAYEKAKLYYRLTTGLSYRSYLEAALVTFKAFKADYPDSKYNEELLYLSVETSYNLAVNSIETKQPERFEQSLALFKEFKQKYPSSGYMARAEKLSDEAKETLEQLKTEE